MVSPFCGVSGSLETLSTTPAHLWEKKTVRARATGRFWWSFFFSNRDVMPGLLTWMLQFQKGFMT
jgi:hypothetical protein